jgi:hypothetical protein
LVGNKDQPDRNGFVSVASTRAEICVYDMSPTKVKLIELDRERYEQT